MKDEIKEILDDLLFTTTLPNVSVKLSEEKLYQLKDYITNLQKEVDKLTAESTEWESKCYDLQEENKTLRKNQRYYKNGVFSLEYDKETLSDMIDDYKSRNEKAIDYIMTELIDEWAIENNGYVSGSDLPADAIIPLLNILKGE